jgi:uncharacterized protein YqhQ
VFNWWGGRPCPPSSSNGRRAGTPAPLHIWFQTLLLSAGIPYGGQAAIEGVMMKGREHAALAIRRRDGRIEILEREAKSRWPRLAATPLIRGVAILIDMFGLGTWALRESAKRYEADALSAEEEKKRVKTADAEGLGALAASATPVPDPQLGEPKESLGQSIVMIASVVIALLIFKVLPSVASTFIFGWLGWARLAEIDHPTLLQQFLANGIEGIVKFSIFIGYVWGVGRMAEIRRVFEYHGAEHIVINAYEDDPKNQDIRFIQSHGVAHPRCGTSFIAILILMSVFLFTLLDWALLSAGAPSAGNLPVWYIRWPLRIIGLLPLAGISYEIIRAAFKYYGNPLLRPLLRFGMLFQVLTVRRPADDQVEVSLAAFNRVRYLTEGIPEPEVQQVREAEAAGAFVA